MTTLMKASNQWSSRPADERFGSLEAMHNAVKVFRDQAAEGTLEYKDLRVEAGEGEPILVSPRGKRANFTHWSFGQLASRIGAPAGFLRQLPVKLTTEILNDRLQNLQVVDGVDGEGKAREAKLLFKRNGEMTVRAFTGVGYARIWNEEITSRLLRLVNEQPCWQPAPAAFDGSRGLYASEKDMFAFLVDNERRIFEKDQHGGLGRGFFVWNSEVGDQSFGIDSFYYEYVCGNHRVWGAKRIAEVRIKHVGAAADRGFAALACEVKKYAESSAVEDEQQIAKMKSFEIGADKQGVLDRLFNLRAPGLTKGLIGQAYALAEKREDWYGNPRSAWGLSGAITEIARDLPNSDGRLSLDRAGGKVLQLAL